ncbi:hypothetical protein [Bacteroides sp. 519]|uniref:hypothetical protein n=1 Tax=Bacteroides sp. 519 TaxID=2302937 RepID=UPI0013D1194B|nr:hypothetical protein [Bacteroides sp. 519]NDV60126.1 hypothetical protein [Bacteroides sp. 519]
MKNLFTYLVVLGMSNIIVSCSSDIEQRMFSQETQETLEKIETLFAEGDVKNETTYQDGIIKIETPIIEDTKLAFNSLNQTRAVGDALILKGHGACPGNSFEVHMDCEDSKSRSSVEGFTGESYVTKHGNVIFKFCIVNSGLFISTNKVPDYSNPLLNRQNFAVISDRIKTDKNSHGFTRFFDCEDSSTDNRYYLNGVQISKATVNSSNWGVHEDNNGNITFSFWLVPLELPDFGNIGYGVFGGDGSIGTLNGKIHTDDEDSSNRNSYQIYNKATLGMINRVASVQDKNTNMYIRRVK